MNVKETVPAFLDALKQEKGKDVAAVVAATSGLAALVGLLPEDRREHGKRYLSILLGYAIEGTKAPADDVLKALTELGKVVTS